MRVSCGPTADGPRLHPEVTAMDFVRLEPEQRRSFKEDVFLVVKHVLDRRQVDLLTEAGDRLA